jgi:uncharacterized membrane protein
MFKIKSYWAAAMLLVLSGLFGSCSGKATSDENQVAETASTVEVQNTQTLVAKFIAVYPNSQGAIFAFTGVDGQDYDFWESDTPAKGMEFMKDLAPNEVNPKFENILFEVTYVNAKKEFPSSEPGETVLRDVMHIVELKQIEEAPKVEGMTPKQFSPEEMMGLVFYGVEPFWDIQLKETHAEYRAPDMKGVLTIDYRRDENDATKAKLSEVMRYKGNNILEIRGFMKEKSMIITIKREACSDGMSDDMHPYSVEFVHGQWGTFRGCGRVK